MNILILIYYVSRIYNYQIILILFFFVRWMFTFLIFCSTKTQTFPNKTIAHLLAVYSVRHFIYNIQVWCEEPNEQNYKQQIIV